MSKEKLVLLVEDDLDIREVMGLLMEADGYRVLHANNAESGQRAVEQHPGVNVIVTDVNIGNGQNGFDMVEQIRMSGCSASVVVVSGDPEATAARLGANDIFLPKPYDRAALFAAIAEACARNEVALAERATH